MLLHGSGALPPRALLNRTSPPHRIRYLCALRRSLFCPNEAPGLSDTCGPAFKVLYEQYEAAGKARKSVKAQQLWFAILESQIEVGGGAGAR